MKITPLNKKLLLYTVFATALLSSCSTGNKVASSFSKRRYTKGYFWNVPARVQGVAANGSKQHIEAIKPIVHGNNAVTGEPAAIKSNPATGNLLKAIAHHAVKQALPHKPVAAHTAFMHSRVVATAQKSVDDSSPANKSITTGKIFIAIACLFMVLALLSSAVGISIWVPLVFAIISLFIAIGFLSPGRSDNSSVNAEPMGPQSGNDYVPDKTGPANGTATQQQPQTNLGGIGFSFVMIGLFFFLVIIALVLAIAASQSYYGLLLGLLALGASTLGLIFFIVGFLLCMNSLHNKNEKHPKLGRAGAIISGVILGLIALSYIISKL